MLRPAYRTLASGASGMPPTVQRSAPSVVISTEQWVRMRTGTCSEPVPGIDSVDLSPILICVISDSAGPTDNSSP